MASHLAAASRAWIALAIAIPLGAQVILRAQLSGKADREKPTRPPRRVAEELAAVHGTRLDQVAYIPALPLIAKSRLGEAPRDPKYAMEVANVLAPYLRGEKSPAPGPGASRG